MEVFREATKSKKALQLVMITTYGVRQVPFARNTTFVAKYKNNYSLFSEILIIIWLFVRFSLFLQRKVRKSVSNIHKIELSSVNNENRKRNHQSVQSMERGSCP